MTPEALTALASFMAAIAAIGSAIAALIGAARAKESKDAAVEARELVRQVIQQINTQSNKQTNAPQTNFYFQGPATVGNLASRPARELVFTPEALPASPFADGTAAAVQATDHPVEPE